MNKKILIVFALSSLLQWGCSLPYIQSHQDPLTPEEHLQLAKAYELKKEYAAAIREYEAASHRFPEAHYYLGNVYFMQDDYRKAERHYTIAIERLPQDPRVYNNLAWLYLIENRNLNKAESLALKGLELAPRDNSASYQDTLNRIRAKKNEF
ncbi:MAG: tetratricopeptide repeat protein [Desulfobacterales bacterium]